MTNDEILAGLNDQWPPCVQLLGGYGTAYDQERRELTMTYQAKPEHCHSGNIVQGGYITAMIDAAMAYAVMGVEEGIEGIATLEIKVSFMAPGRPGPMTCRGWPVNMGRSIGHLEGDLHQGDRLIAKSTTTVKLVRPKPAA